MRLTFRLLGLDLIDLEISTDADSSSTEPDPRDLSGGTLSSMPVGFTARYELPREDDGRDYE